ncbi:MAG TPA: hypothetical protein VGH16_02735 [Candidatus Binatia bacterium]|jgi:hypothetical protein
MSYRSVANWPPAWVARARKNEQEVRGEIGVLKDVIPSIVPPTTRIFLIVEHEDSEYMGCLLFDDPAFCGDIFRILQTHRGWTIRDIGSLDLSCTL